MHHNALPDLSAEFKERREGRKRKGVRGKEREGM